MQFIWLHKTKLKNNKEQQKRWWAEKSRGKVQRSGQSNWYRKSVLIITYHMLFNNSHLANISFQNTPFNNMHSSIQGLECSHPYSGTITEAPSNIMNRDDNNCTQNLSHIQPHVAWLTIHHPITLTTDPRLLLLHITNILSHHYPW